MKRAIITGATGMLGMALIYKLLQEDMEITVIVRPNSSRNNRIPNDNRIRTIECDLSDLVKIENKFENEKQDMFYHLAWGSTYGASRNDMNAQINNIQGTVNAVELAHKLGCKVFVGVGSQAEYGRVDGKISPNTITKPENGYGMAKLCACSMSKVMCDKYNIRYVWMRVLSAYGPFGGQETMVISGIRKMLSGQTPQYTKAEQEWDYIYSSDVAVALWLVGNKENASGIYCLGSGNVRKLSEYIKDIRDVVAPKTEIEFGAIPYYENQVMFLCADITKLKRDVGFCPIVDFKDGIEKTAKWVQEEMSNEKN